MLLFKVLSKPGCHLCDEAKDAILRATKDLLAEVEVVNIETDQALFDQYCNDIPVIFLNDRKIFKHRVDEQKLKKIISSELSALRGRGN